MVRCVCAYDTWLALTSLSLRSPLLYCRKYDPYPCILGIPVMPALFNSSKFYIFIGFMLIGMRVMVACLRQI
jgi:hypothetical protein